MSNPSVNQSQIRARKVAGVCYFGLIADVGTSSYVKMSPPDNFISAALRGREVWGPTFVPVLQSSSLPFLDDFGFRHDLTSECWDLCYQLPQYRRARCYSTNRRSGLRWCWSNRFLMPFMSSTGVTLPTTFVVEQNEPGAPWRLDVQPAHRQPFCAPQRQSGHEPGITPSAEGEKVAGVAPRVTLGIRSVRHDRRRARLPARPLEARSLASMFPARWRPAGPSIGAFARKLGLGI